MKTLLFLLLLISINSLGQDEDAELPKFDKNQPVPLPVVDGKVLYTGIIKADSVSKTELYNRAKTFFVKSYKSANDVIQLDDKESGQLVIKGIFKVSSLSIRHTFSVGVKEGKYRYELGSLVVLSSPPSELIYPMEDYLTAKNKYQKKFSIDVHDFVSKFVQMFIDHMNTKPDDW